MTCQAILCCCLVALAAGSLPAGDVENARYLRLAGKGFETECEFTRKQIKNGTLIESVTFRGKTRMTVLATFDENDMLTAAEATMVAGDDKKSALIMMAGGKAKVMRDGLAAQEFDVPKGVIVTSAPDWTDVWLLCRRYDRGKGGKQEFPGLWIHPVQPGQRLTFTIARLGAQNIEHAGKNQSLDYYKITLRGNSSYSAYADASGQLIKLFPLPAKDGAVNWLVRAGFEKSTAHLRP